MLGKETLFDYIERFGFGEKTGIDLNDLVLEKKQVSIYKAKERELSLT